MSNDFSKLFWLLKSPILLYSGETHDELMLEDGDRTFRLWNYILDLNPQPLYCEVNVWISLLFLKQTHHATFLEWSQVKPFYIVQHGL